MLRCGSYKSITSNEAMCLYMGCVVEGGAAGGGAGPEEEGGGGPPRSHGGGYGTLRFVRRRRRDVTDDGQSRIAPFHNFATSHNASVVDLDLRVHNCTGKRC